MDREYAFSYVDPFKYFKGASTAKDMFYLDECLQAFEKKNVYFADIGWNVYYVSYILLVNCVIQIIYILPDFPLPPALSVLNERY